MLEPGTVEPGAGERQHVEREIQAQAALDLRAEQLEHAPGAGAEIEQRAHLDARERAGDRLLDRLVGDMELADAVPLRGVAAEIGLRHLVALRAHGNEPLAIARQRRVVGIEPRDELARELGRAAALAQTKERPRSFAESVDQAGLGEEPQMARNPRLRLAQDGGEVRHRELGLGEQRENAQPGGLAGGLQRAVERLERQVGGSGHVVGRVPILAYPDGLGRAYKDIFIPLIGNFKPGVGRTPARAIRGHGRDL